MAGAGLTPEDRDAARLRQAVALLELGQDEACRKVLDSLPDEQRQSPEVRLLRSRLLLSSARLYSDDASAGPATIINRSESSDTSERSKRSARLEDAPSERRAVTSAAIYLVGVCYQEMGDLRAALEQFRRVRRLFAETPETLAAGLNEAAALLQMGQPGKALTVYQWVIELANPLEDYSNHWYPLAALRLELSDARREFVACGAFTEAVDFVECLTPVFSAERISQLTAETFEAWGTSLFTKADALPPSQGKTPRLEGRQRFQAAAVARYRLARLRFTTRFYADDLWAASQDFLQAHNYANAGKTLRLYLRQEDARQPRPEAWLGLAECDLALGNVDLAIGSLRHCIDFFPRHPATFQARLLAAKAYFENDAPKAAEQALLDNLQGDDLTPASPEWRESLFDLGRLLFLQQRWSDAAKRLEEAVTRYPRAQRTLEARYLLAESYRNQARASQPAEDEPESDADREARENKVRRLRESALEQLELAVRDFRQHQANADLNALQRELRRNSLFSHAATLLDLGRFSEAANAYTNVISQFQSSPEVLEAYVQLAAAYRGLGEPSKARATIIQAKGVLERLPADAPYSTATSNSRQEWVNYLNLLQEI